MGVAVIEDGGRASVSEERMWASAADIAQAAHAAEDRAAASACEPAHAVRVSDAAQTVSAMSAATVTGNYNALANKPCIESVVLMGNRRLDEFGMGLAGYQDVFDLFED